VEPSTADRASGGAVPARLAPRPVRGVIGSARVATVFAAVAVSD
jgi:hypothetical protein